MEKGYHRTKDGRVVKKGLYYYMNKRKKSGTSRKGKGTVSDKALKRSSRTAKKRQVQLSLKSWDSWWARKKAKYNQQQMWGNADIVKKILLILILLYLFIKADMHIITA